MRNTKKFHFYICILAITCLANSAHAETETPLKKREAAYLYNGIPGAIAAGAAGIGISQAIKNSRDLAATKREAANVREKIFTIPEDSAYFAHNDGATRKRFAERVALLEKEEADLMTLRRQYRHMTPEQLQSLVRREGRLRTDMLALRNEYTETGLVWGKDRAAKLSGELERLSAKGARADRNVKLLRGVGVVMGLAGAERLVSGGVLLTQQNRDEVVCGGDSDMPCSFGTLVASPYTSKRTPVFEATQQSSVTVSGKSGD